MLLKVVVDIILDVGGRGRGVNRGRLGQVWERRRNGGHAGCHGMSVLLLLLKLLLCCVCQIGKIYIKTCLGVKKDNNSTPTGITCTFFSPGAKIVQA